MNTGICKLIIQVNDINRLKDKSHLIISVDSEKKPFDKIGYAFMIKDVEKVELGERVHHNKSYI